MKFKKYILMLILPLIAITSVVLGGCNFNKQSTPAVYVVDIKKTDTSGAEDVYTVYYSNGTSSNFTVNNNGSSQGVTVEDLYNKYVELYGDISYKDFLNLYLNGGSGNNSQTINRVLASSVKLYCEFYSNVDSVKQNSVYTGSGVIYLMDDNYTYIVTNYHMVYNVDANVNNGRVAKIIGYLYGSEGHPIDSGTLDANGYKVYNYGSYAIPLECIGGSISTDLAVLRVATSVIKAINDQVIAATPAEGYQVGETAIAIGNAEDGGISVTQGIISDDNTSITLKIDNTARAYRSLKIDTPLYNGNSGGGLFNAEGALIGIANAGDTQKQNINFAIPIDVVTGVVDGIIFYYNDYNPLTTNTYKVLFNVTVYSQNAKYEFDSISGEYRRVEEVMVDSVGIFSVAYRLGLEQGDQIFCIYINDVKHEICRQFDLASLSYSLRPGDQVRVGYKRGGAEMYGPKYTISENDLVSVD